MILSIISGTYNRIKHLKDMVESARKSMPPGLEYEFVICDAGSTDGSLQWMRDQKDIRIIEHGELKGAIKAFNDAAAAATGDYLCVANDDITFEGYSIAKGLAFIMDHPEIGAGCFSQDRAGKPLHVECMAVNYPDGTQEWLPYLQVGIMPRWLWNKCGGWGDWGGRTYGGDNYLSGKIRSFGYKIVAVPGCSIHDDTPDDALRKANNKDCKDGQILAAKFPKGFEMAPKPVFPNPLPTRKRVLYAPIIEAGHDVQKQQKCGLREALKAIGLVWEVDHKYSEESVADAAEAWNPHITVTQFHTANDVSLPDVKRIKQNCQEALINWNGDVWPNQSSPEMMEILRYYDYHTTVNAALLPKYAATGIKAEYWQNSFEPSVVDNDDKGESFDVVFLGNCYSQGRIDLATALKAMPYKVGVFGRGYPDGIAEGESLYDYRKIGQTYRGAKIAIADNQFLEAKGFFSDRAFMIMASGGCMMLHQEVIGMEELAGLVDGKHYVSWANGHSVEDNIRDLQDKVAFYLEHEDERRLIADTGMANCRTNHSFAKRVEQLQSFIAAIPKKRKTISAMMIVKDEVKNIDACLAQLSWADEIVIVDTGSTDGTLEKLCGPRIEGFETDTPGLIHRSGNLAVYAFPWVDDFSKARNFAKSKCLSEWIFWLDADERLTDFSIGKLKSFDEWNFQKMGTSNPQSFLYKVYGVVDGVKSQFEYQTRLFRNIDQIEWRGAVHENLVPSLMELGISGVAIRSEILHLVDSADIERHQKRNLAMLDKQLWSPLRNYHKGSSYAAMGRWGDALVWFELAERETDDEPFKAFLAFAAGFCFYNMGLPGLALVKFRTTTYPDALYLQAEIEETQANFLPEIYRQFLKTTTPTHFPTFSEGWRAKAKEKLLGWHKKELEALV